MLLFVSILIVGIVASSHILTITPSKSQDINGITTSVTPTHVPSTPTTSESSTPTPAINIDTTNSPVQDEQNSSANFIYPNSTSLGGGLYESSNDPKTVTAWYKEKINNANMNVTSFITTNTNENIKNVLVGDNGEKYIKVEIIKNSGESKTKIKIN